MLVGETCAHVRIRERERTPNDIHDGHGSTPHSTYTTLLLTTTENQERDPEYPEKQEDRLWEY